MKKLLFALIIASLWSFSEIILKSETISIQYHSALLTSLALGFLLLFYSVYKDIKYILIITIATLLIKTLSVPIQGIEFSGLTNSSLAIGLDGIIVSLMLMITKKRKSYKYIALLGFSSAIIISIFFRIIGFYLVPCEYFSSFAGLAGTLRFIYTEGLAWALFSAITAPAFYFLGKLISKKIEYLYLNNKRGYYIGFSLALLLCFSSNIIVLFF